MGTRSLTYVYTETYKRTKPKPIVCMYRQYDGYLSGHGLELAEFLEPITLVNGLGQSKQRVANGMGCLAAQMIDYFKIEAGQIYLYRPLLNQEYGQEYEYHIFQDKVKVFTREEDIFSGTWKEFLDFCEHENKLEEDQKSLYHQRSVA